jgi:deoxyribose-phosphate aldolase
MHGNRGVPFDPAWLDRPPPRDVERRAARYEGYVPEAGALVEELCRIVRAIDLTTLSGDDTPERVRDLCRTARAPLPQLPDVTVATVCVYPALVPIAAEELSGSGVRVATAAAGFPHGLSPLPTRVDEVRACVEMGADEVDVVIQRAHALTGNWRALYDEVAAFREASGEAVLKAILATGELAAPETIYRAGLVCLMAGADFIKTSTGKEAVNATLPAGVVMAAAIRDYEDRTSHRAGLKPAGGIRTADVALSWLELARQELGADRTGPDLFRLGASGLLKDIRGRLGVS